ncbi:ABC transporter permease [Pseudonocardia hispaniensis]|uniref:ABC transporter permease n=1 Tax=Pseudonocardia hispaniensis TaxID=904933 RepID=A0ABW1J5Z1_9PSEU
MGESGVVVGWQLGVAVVALVALAALTGGLGGLRTSTASAVAAVRAVVQLAVVSTLILAVVRSWWATGLFVLIMFGVATWTAARRITPSRSGLHAGLAILTGAVPVIAIILATGAVPLVGIAVVPIAGIVIGGAMTATSLAGRRALDELHHRRGEYEAALSLGLAQRDASLLLIRPSARDALVPALDQTRTVGLVTLPGAFVGVLMGGGGPLQAGAAQVLVLVGLLAAETLAVLVTVELIAHARIHRRDDHG